MGPYRWPHGSGSWHPLAHSWYLALHESDPKLQAWGSSRELPSQGGGDGTVGGEAQDFVLWLLPDGVPTGRVVWNCMDPPRLRGLLGKVTCFLAQVLLHKEVREGTV